MRNCFVKTEHCRPLRAPPAGGAGLGGESAAEQGGARAVYPCSQGAHSFGVAMPINPPVLVPRAHIGKGPGIVLISFAAPAGELGKGSVENVEVTRIAMTHATFKEFASLFN